LPPPKGDNSKTENTQTFSKASSPEPAGQFQSNLVQIIFGLGEFKIFQIKGHVIFKGELITKMQMF
jgi:hypothetical protein